MGHRLAQIAQILDYAEGQSSIGTLPSEPAIEIHPIVLWLQRKSDRASVTLRTVNGSEYLNCLSPFHPSHHRIPIFHNRLQKIP